MRARTSVRIKRNTHKRIRKPLLLFKIGVLHLKPNEVDGYMHNVIGRLEDIKVDFHVIATPDHTSDKINIIRYE